MSYNQSPVMALPAPQMYHQPHPAYSAAGPGPSNKRTAQDPEVNSEWTQPYPAIASGSTSQSSWSANSDGAPRPKKKAESKKRLQSCDVCRARKVKCAKEVGADACEGCKELGQTCEYTHERRKPGPANGFQRKSRPPKSPKARVRGQSQAPEITHSEPNHVRSQSHGALPSFDMPPPPLPWSPSPPVLFDTSVPPFELQPLAQLATVADFVPDFSFLPISPQSLLHPQPGEQDSASEGTPTGRWSWIPGFDDLWDDKNTWLDPVPEPYVMPELHNRDHMPPVPTRSQVEQATMKLGQVARLEDVAPLSTITRILQGYYAHLYALMPVVHWPSFSQQLVAREDERSEPWRAFVLSLVAYSIIQLPRSVLAFLPVRDLRRLHQRCHAESRKLQNRTYNDVQLIHISTLYCDHIYLGTLGRTHIANVILAEAIRLAQTINLHDERIGDHVSNVIERETRRRVFWLLYGSDRTISALTSAPMHIQDCDLFLPLPLAIDDCLLTAAGAFPQPATTIPLLAGFHFNCRIFRLLGAVQTAHRNLLAGVDPILRLPPVPAHIRPSCEFMDELDRMIQDLPGPLQLVNPTPQLNAGSDKDSSFATCRANLLISQAMVRFAIRQYARAAGEVETEARDWAERDVLHLLESMSSESLAANGESLRRKVLFVASSLLEKYPSSAEGHSYVADFLAVYTRISEEQHVALLEVSAAPSRETSPQRRLSAV